MSSRLTIFALFTAALFAQSNETKLSMGSLPSFEIADVRPSPRSANMNRFMNGPTAHAGRYIIRTASMLDLVSHAYNMDPDRVYGGPSWLEMDRFDIVAKLPPASTPDTQKLMLQSLLAERFSLKLHTDQKPLAAFALTAGKHNQLKEAGESGDQGCKFEVKNMPNGPPAEGAAPPKPELIFTCHNMTMTAFAEGMRNMPLMGQYLNNKPVVDQSELKGSWDFKFTVPFPARMVGGTQPTDSSATLFEVLDKQVGLKLEPVKLSLPVIAIDSVNQKPTDNSPDAATALAGSTPPTEFDAAAIKPTDTSFNGINFNIDKSGNVTIRGATLKFLMQQIWNFPPDMIIGAPKWMDTGDRWDIIAKPPSAAVIVGGGQNSPPVDFETVLTMLKSLLAERFKLVTHLEEQPVSAYTLMAAKPKMKTADPAGRTKCFEGPGPDGKDPREANPILGRLITCQNMSMPQLADLLQGLAPGYIHSPVLDATGLAGNFDFTLSFSPAGAGRGGRGGDASTGPISAADPSGALSLLDALPKQLGLKLELQKRPVQVLVIDHVEPKPTEN